MRSYSRERLDSYIFRCVKEVILKRDWSHDRNVLSFCSFPSRRGGTSYENVAGQKKFAFLQLPPTIPVCPPPHLLGAHAFFSPPS